MERSCIVAKILNPTLFETEKASYHSTCRVGCKDGLRNQRWIENHRKVESIKDLFTSLSNSLVQVGSARAGCSGLCPVGF